MSDKKLEDFKKRMEERLKEFFEKNIRDQYYLQQREEMSSKLNKYFADINNQKETTKEEACQHYSEVEAPKFRKRKAYLFCPSLYCLYKSPENEDKKTSN